MSNAMYQNLKRCEQQRSDCFAYLLGRCNCLQDTSFEAGRVCPFYKSRNEMPDFHEYYAKYISRREITTKKEYAE